MKSIESVLKKIRVNPERFIGKPSLKRLDIFINGYLMRQMEEEQSENFPLFYDGFQEYIQNRYQIYTTHSLFDIINFYSESDKHAFYLFYEYLDDFIREGKQKI